MATCRRLSGCLPEHYKGSTRLKKIRVLWSSVALVLVDGISGFALIILQSERSEVGTSVFSEGIVDIITLGCIRLTLVSLSVGLGNWAWQRVQPQSGASADQTNSNEQSSSDRPLQRLGNTLLSSASPDSDESFMFSAQSLDEERRKVEASRKGERYRNATIWVVFVVCSLSAVYSGVKCVSFGTRNAFENSSSMLTILIGAVVFMSHGEFYMAKKVLETWTTAEGLNFPWLHPHTLQFVLKAEFRMCQSCRSKIRVSNHGGMAYFCPLCDKSYYCIDCLKRQLRQRQSTTGSSTAGESLEEAGEQQPNTTCDYLRRVFPLIRPFIHIVILSFVTVVINQAFRLAQPHWQGILLDAISKHDSQSFHQAVVVYLLINIGSGFVASVQSSAVLMVRRRLAFRTRLMTFKHILRQDIAYFDANVAGQITSRLTNDAMQMTDPVSIIMNNLLSNLILLAGGLFMCFHTSWKLSILAMTAIFPITYMVRTYSEWAGKIGRKIHDELAEGNALATQAIQNMRTVRYFGAETFESDRYETSLTNVFTLQMKDSLTRIASSTCTSYLDLSVGVFVLWYGGSVIIHGSQSHFSLGQLITFQLYWTMMKNSFSGLNDVLSSLLRATSASQRILELLDLNPTVETGEGTMCSDGDVLDGTIVFEAVAFDYAQKRSQKPVLNNVNLQIRGGQVTAIVGKSGSGKSTIASLVMRLYDPISGRISLDGKDYRSFLPQSLRVQFGVVAQETQLFAGSIEDNIAYAMQRPYTLEDMKAAASKANALEFVEKCEDGFKTLVGDRGVLLSGGQKQRVSIARMFLRQPRFLLLDEATSALDAENEALVQEALDGLVESGLCRTVIVIAHRLSTVRNADQIAVMEEGELKELGRHEELLEIAGIYAQLVQRQLHAKSLHDLEPSESKSGGKGVRKQRRE